MPDAALPLFEFEGQPLRVHLDDAGEPWFVAKDAALALDYEWKGISTIGHVPVEWRRVYSVQTLQRGLQNMLTLSEQGLYFFVARSDKPRALPFQKWLAGEVLPALRRKGYYEMPGRSGSRPVDLNPAALRLRPALRERILGSAMQCARLMGASSMAEVESIFCRCCELVASTPEQTLLPADKEAGLIRDFVGECCRNSKGAKTTAGAVYDHFRVWWNQRSKEPLPSQKRLGALLQERFVRHRRGGRIWYLDLACIM